MEQLFPQFFWYKILFIQNHNDWQYDNGEDKFSLVFHKTSVVENPILHKNRKNTLYWNYLVFTTVAIAPGYSLNSVILPSSNWGIISVNQFFVRLIFSSSIQLQYSSPTLGVIVTLHVLNGILMRVVTGSVQDWGAVVFQQILAFPHAVYWNTVFLEQCSASNFQEGREMVLEYFDMPFRVHRDICGQKSDSAFENFCRYCELYKYRKANIHQFY